MELQICLSILTSFALNHLNLFSDNGICGKPFTRPVGCNSCVEFKYRYENGRFQRAAPKRLSSWRYNELLC